MQRAQADGEEVAQPLRFGTIAGGGAVLADDRARDEPVGVRVIARQIFDDFGAEAEFVERGAHARFVGECAGGRGLRVQGVATRALRAECIHARLGRAARVVDRVAVREAAYDRRCVGYGGDWCALHEGS